MITFHHNLDLQQVSRRGYTVLDLIANVGGLRTIMAFVISYMMRYWSFQTPQNFMVTRLFTFQRNQAERNKSGHDEANRELR